VFDDDIDTLHYHTILIVIPGHLHVVTVNLVAMLDPVDSALYRPAISPGSSRILANHDPNRITLFYPFHLPISTACCRRVVRSASARVV
jgi:hypothetical protein